MPLLPTSTPVPSLEESLSLLLEDSGLTSGFTITGSGFSIVPLGIETVITLCVKPLRHRNPDINYVHVPIADGTPITTGQFQSVMDAIWQNIGGKVLLHCGGGMSRTPVVCSAWMHSVGYKNIDAALEEIAMLRPTIDPSPILLLSIREHLK